MIRSKSLVPDYWYKNSRDINVFLRLIDLVVNSAKCDTDNFINILNPDRCRSDLLPILSSYLGYDYCITETPDSNRVAMSNFRDIITNRGSRVGIETAVKAAISMKNSYYKIDTTKNMVNVTYHDSAYVCNNCGNITYSKTDRCLVCGSRDISNEDVSTILITVDYPLYSSLVYYLVEKARPAGTSCIMRNGNIVSSKETIGITDYLNILVNKYNNGRSDVSGLDSNVGFTEIYKQGYKYLVCNVCGSIIKPDSGYDINSLSSCPSCGFSGGFTIRDNTDVKLLYGLYDSNKELSSVYNAISMGSVGDMKIVDKVVGLIVRIKAIDESTGEIYYKCKLTGIVPYLEIHTDNNGDTVVDMLNEYTFEDILDSIYQGEDILISRDDEDPNNIKYYIQDIELSRLNDNYHTVKVISDEYYLSDYKIYCSYGDSEINDPYWDIGENGRDNDIVDCMSSTQIYEMSVDSNTGKYRFRIGDSGYSNIDDYIVSDNSSHSQEYTNTILSNDMDMNVCASCGKYIPKNIFNNVCPFCGGQLMEGYTEASSSYNPTILQGSYILDLEFRCPIKNY